jgi:hypothetical protein
VILELIIRRTALGLTQHSRIVVGVPQPSAHFTSAIATVKTSAMLCCTQFGNN